MVLVREMKVLLIPQHTWVASMASKVQPRSSRAACYPRESESLGSLFHQLGTLVGLSTMPVELVVRRGSGVRACGGPGAATPRGANSPAASAPRERWRGGWGVGGGVPDLSGALYSAPDNEVRPF